MNKLIVFTICCCCNLIFSLKELTHDVYFDTDKHQVASYEENRLLTFISTLKTLEIASISIFGFCDDTGAANYNLILSQQRADAIKSIFSNHDINEALISNVDGKGQILLKKIEDINLLKTRGQNRKVSIIVKPKPPTPIRAENVHVVKNHIKSAVHLLKGDLKVGDTLTLENIYFTNGYSYPKAESKKTLEAIADILVKRNGIYFSIQGHVCCTPYTRDAVDKKTKKHNLSLARAKYIYDYFEKKGIDKKRMRYLGMRRKFPLGGDPKFDRRVELIITYIKDENL
ncbi:OmpA family protein [Mariniflexile ostreae]|uniref:OmpA family protein n=1 Tax=Mariniflexile ostreae TaxID=1520892 RepID=A0ABV5FBM0_9FLAO